MAADFLSTIDWSRPWLAHIRNNGEEIAAATNWRSALNAHAVRQGLRNHQGLPIRFVPQSDLPAGVAYETFIHASGGVPTRENLHDFFNALIWLTFPRIKVQLNALQAVEIARARAESVSGPIQPSSSGSMRGKLRDAATIFDENAALLVTSDASLASALRSHAWQEVFVERREAFLRCSQVLLFGHALMEKLVAPYKSITGHMWVVAAESLDGFALPLHEQCGLLDKAVSTQLKDGLTTKDFSPLPILGVPGWWEGQDRTFYADTMVFRPRRNC